MLDQNGYFKKDSTKELRNEKKNEIIVDVRGQMTQHNLSGCRRSTTVKLGSIYETNGDQSSPLK